MKHVLKQFAHDEAGFIVSAELILIATIAVLGLVVGLSEVAAAINNVCNSSTSAGLMRW